MSLDVKSLPAHQLNVAARLPQTEAEGPGVRYALWVQGCPLRCPGCCNPHMLAFEEATVWDVQELAQEIVNTEGIEGLTLIGGEPFAQAAPLAALCKTVREAGLSVMAFSGFTLRVLQNPARADWQALLAQLDLLVDGPYIQEQQVQNRRWIGSANQEVHFLTERYAHMREEQEGWDPHPNTIELRLVNGQIFINGFPHEDVTEALQQFAPPPRIRRVTREEDA